MKKSGLIDSVSGNRSVLNDMAKKDITSVIETTFTQIAAAIHRDGYFAVPGFGSFRRTERAARIGRNPRTGASIKIEASTTVTFRPAKELKAFMEAENEGE